MQADAPEVIPPEVILQAYSCGIFPMADSDTGRIGWFEASPRAILPLETLHVPRRLQRRLRNSPWTVTEDRAFAEVIRACGSREQSWIDDVMLRSYCLLHDLGYAHSLEVWNGGTLVGGLYGVHLSGAFFGESVFHRETDAGKAAVVALAGRLRGWGFRLLDIQMVTGLTRQFGPRIVSRREYLRLLQDALAHPAAWGDPPLGG